MLPTLTVGLDGRYRMVYYGDSKAPFSGEITSFTGVSQEFTAEWDQMVDRMVLALADP